MQRLPLIASHQLDLIVGIPCESSSLKGVRQLSSTKKLDKQKEAEPTVHERNQYVWYFFLWNFAQTGKRRKRVCSRSSLSQTQIATYATLFDDCDVMTPCILAFSKIEREKKANNCGNAALDNDSFGRRMWLILSEDGLLNARVGRGTW